MQTHTIHFFNDGDESPFYSITFATNSPYYRQSIPTYDLREGIISDLCSSYKDSDTIGALSALDVIQTVRSSLDGNDLSIGEHKSGDVIIIVVDDTPPTKYCIGDTVFLECRVDSITDKRKYNLKPIDTNTSTFSIYNVSEETLYQSSIND